MMTDTFRARSNNIGDIISDYSDPSPCSSYETANIPSVQGSSPSKSVSCTSTHLASTSSPPSSDPGSGSMQQENNMNYVAYPLSKQQLSLLLVNDLQQRREANKAIDQRYADDEKIFKEIESTLCSKVEKYHQRNTQRILTLGIGEHDNIPHINNVLDQIIDFDADSLEIKKEIRKKRWYHDRNALYRKISENNQLMNEIDTITQKIDYWQQMIVAGMTRPQITNGRASGSNNKESKITPFVVKEALRIRAENEDTLLKLRVELDGIRAQRA